MEKYGGTIVHQGRDRWGLIEVVEDRFERTLHFGTAAKQSSMALDDPIRLTLGYTRAMASALLFTPNPRRVLLVGLGGGSLARFLLHHFPQCEIDAVEMREAVYHVARRWFHLPDDPRLTVFIDDGAQFVARREAHEPYDLLLVDAFLQDGVADSVCLDSFYRGCRELLNPEGTLALNLWSGDTVRAPGILDMLTDAFGDTALRLPVEGKDNIIGLAGNTGLGRRRLPRLREAAQLMAQPLDVEFPAFLKKMRRSGSWLPFRPALVR